MRGEVAKRGGRSENGARKSKRPRSESREGGQGIRRDAREGSHDAGTGEGGHKLRQSQGEVAMR